MFSINSVKLGIFVMAILFMKVEMVFAGETDAIFHNKIRQALNNGTSFDGYDYSLQKRPATPMPDIVYDTALEDSSSVVAQTCDFNHSTTMNGENLYASTGASTVENAVNSWASEVMDYDNDTGCTAGKVCGHYTQVVWADSLNVGCSALLCSPLRDGANLVFGGTPATFVVCQYSPAGNFIGEKPYVSGNTAVIPPILFLLENR